jgi:hypothetical protein
MGSPIAANRRGGEAAVATEAEVRKKHEYQAYMEDPPFEGLIQRDQRKSLKNIHGKIPSGTSFATSVNDAGRSHATLHAYYNSKDYKWATQRPPDPFGQKWIDLKAYFQQRLNKKSMDTLWSFAATVPEALDKAYTTDAIKNAF